MRRLHAVLAIGACASSGGDSTGGEGADGVVSVGLDAASRAAVRSAILTLACPRRDRRHMAAPFDGRRGTAGFGSAMNVFLTQALQLLRRNQTLDIGRYSIRDSGHGDIFNHTRCPSGHLACLYRPPREFCPAAPGSMQAQGPAAGGASAPSDIAAGRTLRGAHPFAVANEAAKVFFQPNGWLEPQTAAMEARLGWLPDVAVHVRRGDRYLQDHGLDCLTCSKSKHAKAREAIVQNPSDKLARLVLDAAAELKPGFGQRGRASRPRDEHGGRRAAQQPPALRVLVLSDDVDAPAELARALPDDVHVAALVGPPPPPPIADALAAVKTQRLEQGTIAANLTLTPAPTGGGSGRGAGVDAALRRRLFVHSFPEMELGAFLISAMLIFGQARIVMANSGSNFGGLMMTLAGARENTHAPRRPPPPGAQDAPRLWDFDGHLPADGLRRGLYFCDLEWGGRHGVCTAKMLAERRSMLFV